MKNGLGLQISSRGLIHVTETLHSTPTTAKIKTDKQTNKITVRQSIGRMMKSRSVAWHHGLGTCKDSSTVGEKDALGEQRGTEIETTLCAKNINFTLKVMSHWKTSRNKVTWFDCACVFVLNQRSLSLLWQRTKISKTGRQEVTAVNKENLSHQRCQGCGQPVWGPEISTEIRRVGIRAGRDGVQCWAPQKCLEEDGLGIHWAPKVTQRMRG